MKNVNIQDAYCRAAELVQKYKGKVPSHIINGDLTKQAVSEYSVTYNTLASKGLNADKFMSATVNDLKRTVENTKLYDYQAVKPHFSSGTAEKFAGCTKIAYA